MLAQSLDSCRTPLGDLGSEPREVRVVEHSPHRVCVAGSHRLVTEDDPEAGAQHSCTAFTGLAIFAEGREPSLPLACRASVVTMCSASRRPWILSALAAAPRDRL